MTGYSVLSTAISGLNAAQRGMDVTSQNIVNGNTPGYSRQLVKLNSVAPSLVSSFHTGGNSTVIGGVQLDSVVRVRDQFLEATRAQAGGAKAALDAQSSALTGIETLVNEPSNSSLQSAFSKFFDAWGSLASTTNNNAASASAAGQVVLQQGANVASQLNLVSAGLNQQWSTQHSDLKSTVGQLNEAASALAQLNGQIVSSSAGTGKPTNELLDKRDLLLRNIAELGGGSSTIQPDGTATVAVGGATIVHQTQTVTLQLAGGGALSDVAAGDPPRIETAGGVTIAPGGGRVAGLLAAISTDIPALATQLDETATSLIDMVNQVHSAGYTLGGGTGIDFFSGSNAADIRVAVTTTASLAVASAPGTVSGANAQLLADLASDAGARAVLGDAGPAERWRSLASGLGSKIQGLDSATSVQKTILDSADAAVESNAGVNLDEEMTNLLQYQRAYQAAAKVITAIDEMMDTLINRTGI